MATTRTIQPRIDPLMGPAQRTPIDDERELLETGTQGIASNIAKQPILGSYLPVNPVQRLVLLIIYELELVNFNYTIEVARITLSKIWTFITCRIRAGCSTF